MALQPFKTEEVKQSFQKKYPVLLVQAH